MPSDNTVIVKEVRGRAPAEIESLLATKVEELYRVKISHALGQLDKTHSLKQLKRDIAKLKTVLRQATPSQQVEA